ncbi:MAG: isopentenyl phosphate kinase [Anaerolineales bacterium]|jgi:isopentenyl phosphate kinase
MTSIPPPSKRIQFIKLGGSLITDKTQPHTHRSDILQRIAGDISHAYQQNPELCLILGHGSGSYGHRPAAKYKTRHGVYKTEDWLGFIKVWKQATKLNHIVMEALQKVGIPAISFPPSGSVTTHDRKITEWNIKPIIKALEANLLPVIYGDVVFDQILGGTILSTEELFAYLGRILHPTRILIAGIDKGVWADFPTCTKVIDEITPGNSKEVLPIISGSEATDVTGGMASKIELMLSLIEDVPEIEVMIFSGEAEDSIREVLQGAPMGTWLHID